jgi:hypothetical protein
MKARLLTMLVLGVALLSMPALALGGDARHASNSATFPDSTGEDAAAPDITTVTVANDDAGLITFTVGISNRPALTADMYFLVFLDTDKNTNTGSTDSVGADYVIQLVPGAVDLFQWNGTTFAHASSQASLTFSYTPTGPVIKIGAADLSKTKSFNFAVVAASGFAVDASGNPDFSNEHRDYAPDLGHGFNTYNVLTKLVLTVTAFTTAPKPAKAGRTPPRWRRTRTTRPGPSRPGRSAAPPRSRASGSSSSRTRFETASRSASGACRARRRAGSFAA